MKLIAPRALYVVALARTVEAGEIVDVDDTAGQSLVEQGWQQPAPKKKPSRQAAPKKKPSPPPAKKSSAPADLEEE